MKLARASGFTLIETLVAMALISAVLLPTSFWLYRSRTSQAAWEKFQAAQLLEVRMYRALLLRTEQDIKETVTEPGYYEIEIKVVRDGEEKRLVGSARNRRGKELVTLVTVLFGEPRK